MIMGRTRWILVLTFMTLGLTIALFYGQGQSSIAAIDAPFWVATAANPPASSPSTLVATPMLVEPSSTVAAKPSPVGISSPEVPIVRQCQLAPLKSLAQLTNDGFTQTLGEVYNTDGKSVATANLFWVKNGPPRPAVIFNHGVGGQPPGFSPSVHRLISEGFAMVAPGHLPGNGPIFPKYISNIRCAVRWVRANADRFNIDPNRIIVSGFSMGGWISGLVGVTANRPEFDGPCTTNREVDASVLGVVATAAIYDFSRPPLPSKGLIQSILGRWPSRARQAAASAVTYVDRTTPPYVIIQGQQDQVIPAGQADIMAATLKAAGVPFALLNVNEGHAPKGDATVLYEGGDPVLSCTILNFLKTISGLK